ncbi:hypothetical protein U1Q18_049751 [Sarracenia purpurea var. burkii]
MKSFELSTVMEEESELVGLNSFRPASTAARSRDASGREFASISCLDNAGFSLRFRETGPAPNFGEKPSALPVLSLIGGELNGQKSGVGRRKRVPHRVAFYTCP